MKEEQQPDGRINELQSMVMAEPKQISKKNKISHVFLKTESKANCVPSPMLIHRNSIKWFLGNALSEGLLLASLLGISYGI